MKLVFFMLAVLCYLQVSSAFWNSGPDWDGLKVTFGFFSGFNSLPRTTAEAVSMGWALETGATCDGPYNGFRYIKGSDVSAMVLFDKNGYIAGLQAGIPKTKVYPREQNRKYHVFLEEDDKWVITAYFTDPSKICTTGRTAAEYAAEGTGTMMALQNGSTAASVMRMPLLERDVSSTPFVAGKCFYWMGNHYWYNQSEAMSCDDTFPLFLMYNRGKLNAFGWAFNPFYDTSDRWEHPTASVFGNFINNPPSCLGRNDPVTTMHVYLTDSPRSNYC